jgi:hypothetical protein
MTLSKSDASARFHRAGSGDDEVQSAEIADKVQVDLLCEQLGTVERRREPGFRDWNASRSDEVEAHRHGDRLEKRPLRADE